MRTGVKPGQWGWTFADLEAAWAAAEECGFDLLSCFDHVTAAPAARTAWDAPSLLVAMAGRTSAIRLAVHVLNAALREPFLLAAQIAVAQAASAGRVEVGLGAGSYHLARFDHRATGIPFPPLAGRMDRLEACCRVLPALWRGEEVTDDRLDLRGASLGPIGIDPPPVVVGGRSDRAIQIAARFADAWNVSGSDPGQFARDRGRLEAACRLVGRDRAIEAQAQVFLRDAGPAGPRERLRRLEDAGAYTVVFVLDEERGAHHVRGLAQAVL